MEEVDITGASDFIWNTRTIMEQVKNSNKVTMIEAVAKRYILDVIQKGWISIRSTQYILIRDYYCNSDMIRSKYNSLLSIVIVMSISGVLFYLFVLLLLGLSQGHRLPEHVANLASNSLLLDKYFYPSILIILELHFFVLPLDTVSVPQWFRLEDIHLNPLRQCRCADSRLV